ncbi:MAG: helix-turn-helix transcriptional regulator [Bacillota bacterium]
MKIKLKSPDELRRLIAQKGMTQKEFAARIGLSYVYLNKIVNEQLFPSPKSARKIYKGLGVKLDHLFFIESGD